MEESSVEGSVEGPPIRTSHLPKWVLEMRSKIRQSQINHSSAEDSIQRLKKNTVILTDKLEIMRPPIPETTQQPQAGPSQLLLHMPPDVLNLIMGYMYVENILYLRYVCKSMRVAIDTNIYWYNTLPMFSGKKNSPYNSSSLSLDLYRDHILTYLKNAALCLRFISNMKHQRCVPKHRSIQPHRHSKSERSVTHPLPLFHDPNGITRNGSAVATAAKANGEVIVGTEMIMSRSETLGSDFRSFAHNALKNLYMFTSRDDITDPLYPLLINEGKGYRGYGV